MTQVLKNIFCIMLLFNVCAHAKVIPYISIRSQSENAARELVLWQTQINLSCMDKVYGSLSITPEFTRTFNANKIAHCLFSDALDNECCNSPCVAFAIQGSEVTNRKNNALLAENFGLPTDFSSSIVLEPRVENFLVDFNFYLGLDEWFQGLYVRIHTPVVHTRWGLNLCERDLNAGGNPYNTGYFNGTIHGTEPGAYYGVARSELLDNFTSFVCKHQTPQISGVTFQALEQARMAQCMLEDTKLAEIQMALGWNFCMSPCYHVGVNIRGAGPTGTRPYACWLFEPIVGNGKHWEFGGGLSAHWTTWLSDDECKNVSLYLDANITHLFKTRQLRTFDLCGKPLSRYMLAARMKQPALNLQNPDGEIPSYQFADEFAPIANLSTIEVDVSAAVQADIVLKLAYTHRNFQLDLGYEFWGRSCEKIVPRCACSASEEGVWALKGDAYVYGFTASTNSIALSASQKDATIFCGTSGATRTDIRWTLNPGVDNAQCAFDDNANPLTNNYGYGVVGEGQMYSSFDSTVFNTSETKFLDINGAQSRGISNKIFCNVGYIWNDCCDWTPYIGLGAEAEVGVTDKKCCCVKVQPCVTKTPAATCTLNKSCCTACCDLRSTSTRSCCNNTYCNDNCCCTDCALSQWGIWVKGGFSFR